MLKQVAPALAVLLYTGLCHAAILDTFSRTGDIVETSPDTGGGTYLGSPGEFIDDGSKLQAQANGGHGTDGLTISIPTGAVITASVDIQVASATDFNWLSLGFMSPAPGQPQGDIGGPMYELGDPWVFVRGRGNVEGLATDVNTANGSEFDLGQIATPGAVTRVALVLDTRPADWTVSLYLNGAFDGQATYLTNPTITYVGLGHDLAAGSFDNFSVSIATPEPASLSLLSLPPILLLRRKLKPQ